jgi:hypothetical protein
LGAEKVTMSRTISSNRAFLAGAMALAAVAVGIGLSPSSTSAQGLNASIGDVPVARGTEAMRALSENEQLARAFAAAFSGGKERVELESGGIMVYRPGALAWTSLGAVLISSGTVDEAGPDDFAALAVHYLKPEGTTFKVTGAYPNGIEGSLMGGPPKWVVSTDFSDKPVVVTETFGSWQGVACSTTALYELGGGEPVSLGAFRSGYDNIGSEGQGPKAVSITGSIRNIVRGKSFEVHFDGTSRFKQFFARKGTKYVKTGGDGELPDC